MSLRNLWILICMSCSGASPAAYAGAPVTEIVVQPSLAVRVLEQALKGLPSSPQGATPPDMLARALVLLRAGRIEDGYQKLVDLRADLGESASRSRGGANAAEMNVLTRTLLFEDFARRSPREFRAQISAFLLGLEAQLEETRKLEHRLRDRKLLAGVLSPLRSALLDDAYEKTSETLASLRSRLRQGSLQENILFIQHSSEFIRRYTAFLGAYLDRYGTVRDHAERLDQAVDDFFQTGTFRVVAWDYEAIGHEEGEAKLRIYVNRETIGAVATSIAIAVEFGGIVFTGGASAGVAAATMGTLYRGLQVTSYGLSVASGVFGISERLQQDGIKGMLAFDTMLNLVGMAKALPISYKSILGIRAVESLSHYQRAFDLAWTGRRCLYAVYQLTQVDELSRRWQLEPLTVRRNAIISLLVGLLAGGKRTFYPDAPRSSL